MFLFLSFVIIAEIVFPQDLWSRRGEIFTDTKLRPVGSVIYIRFEDDIVASYRSRLDRFRTRNRETLSEIPTLLDFLPNPGGTARETISGDTELSLSHNMRGTVSAVITAVNSRSGTYTITASRLLLLDGKSRTLGLSGIVNAIEVSSDGYISSQKIANTRMRFFGLTVEKESKKIKTSDFKHLRFGDSNVSISNGIISNGKKENPPIELSDPKKRELFLEFFNLIMSELF